MQKKIAHIDSPQWDNNTSPIVFNPQLVPVSRGILSVITIPLAEGDVQRAAQALVAHYAGEPWVTVLEEPTMPNTLHTTGTNRAIIGYRCEKNCIVVCCAIDNLGKGAAGQAVQNFNIRFSFPETLGLPPHAI